MHPVKLENMNKVFYLIPLIFGLGLAVTTNSLDAIQQEVYATAYGGSSSEDVIANPSGLPISNTTGLDNITSANPVVDNSSKNLGKDNPVEVPVS